MNLKKFRNNRTAVIILVVLAVIVVSPIFQNLKGIGSSDWDTHLTYNLVALKSIQEFKQFPLWNPYECGGTPLLAHPESLFMTPFFVFILLFGAAIGVKLQILAHLILGLIGMYYLSRYLKISFEGSLLSSVILMLSSVYPLHIVMGHTLWLSAAFIPWVYLFYLKSWDNIKFSYLSVIFLSLMFFSGSTYIFAFSMLFLGIDFFVRLIFQERKHIKPFIIIVLLTILICSIKALPMMEFLPETKKEQYGLEQDEGFGYSFSGFFQSLVENPQKYDYQEVLDGYKYYWFEYSQYIGLLGLLLAITGMIFSFRKNKELVVILLIVIILAFGKNFFVNLWSILHMLPLFNSLKAPSRLNIFIIFLLALFVGESLRKLKDYRIIKWLVILGVIVNLAIVNIQIYSNEFIDPQPIENKAFFSQNIDTNPESVHPITGWSYSMYEFALQDKGTVNCYEKVHLPSASTPFQSLDYKGEAYDSSIINYVYWSPNKLSIERPGTVNQNFDDDWKDSSNNAGLIKANEKTIYYLPKTFIIGSLITMCAAFFMIINSRKKWIKKFFK